MVELEILAKIQKKRDREKNSGNSGESNLMSIVSEKTISSGMSGMEALEDDSNLRKLPPATSEVTGGRKSGTAPVATTFAAAALDASSSGSNSSTTNTTLVSAVPKVLGKGPGNSGNPRKKQSSLIESVRSAPQTAPISKPEDVEVSLNEILPPILKAALPQRADTIGPFYDENGKLVCMRHQERKCFASAEPKKGDPAWFKSEGLVLGDNLDHIVDVVFDPVKEREKRLLALNKSHSSSSSSRSSSSSSSNLVAIGAATDDKLKRKKKKSTNKTPLVCPFNNSHLPILLVSDELEAKGIFIDRNGLNVALGGLFGAKFIWNADVYINELFNFFSCEKICIIRTDPMTRANETSRTIGETVERVLRFKDFLEIMTLCEEDYSGLKSLEHHPLFSSQGKSMRIKMAPKHLKPFVDLRELEFCVIVDTLKQYDRGLDQPFKQNKNKNFRTMQGMKDKHRAAGKTELECHMQYHALRTVTVANMIDKLFM